MATSQLEFAQQMVAQLRLLKPGISAEVGTPERLILDVAAQGWADSQIDLIGLQNAFNLETKFGSNLDSFLSIFSFKRIAASSASGFVVFSRNVTSASDITIPKGTLVESSVISPNGQKAQFQTISSAILKAGSLQTSPVPIEATTPGSLGNVEANKITIMGIGGQPVLGITAVTNPTATTNGADQEDDNSFKVRFKNTVFRNLAGTQDQFIALAISTAFSTKANVIGPTSKYQEYIQVPLKKDTEEEEYGNIKIKGVGNKYTGIGTISSGSKNLKLEPEIPKGTPNSFLEKEGVVKVGDTVTLYHEGQNPTVALTSKVTSITSNSEIVIETAAGSTLTKVVCLIGTNVEPVISEWTSALSTIPYARNVWSANPIFISNGQTGAGNYFFRELTDFAFNYPGLLQGDTFRAWVDGVGLDPRFDVLGSTQPNVTFLNVYTGTNTEIKSLTPEDIVLLEYEYTSTSSRNDPTKNVTNAVDVYVDGQNEQASTTIFSAPLSPSAYAFVDEPTSAYHYENYRRDGEPAKRPMKGNILTTLFQEPVLSLPAQITIGSNNYYLGTHYWLVHDVSTYGGTVRARDGIEWAQYIKGDTTGLGPQTEPLESPPAYAGTAFPALPLNSAVDVENYTFDQNIRDLQAALLGSRQITTDVLAHKGFKRYFKFDITVMYSPSGTVAEINNNIQKSVATYLANQYFGSVIRLSDILQQVHNVPGVENVRWSNDIPKSENLIRVYETDIKGRPLLNVEVSRFRPGTAGSTEEIQKLYVVGQPTGGSFTLTYKGHTAITIEISKLTAAEIETKINASLGASTVTVTEENRSTTGVTYPIKSFQITFKATGPQVLPSTTVSLTGGSYVFDNDFFLRDDELPTLPTGTQTGDTVAGFILRPRAQNTWIS